MNLAYRILTKSMTHLNLRAAIVAGAYKLRDEQAEIVKTELSKIIGREAADYLSGADKIEVGAWADFFHALSEGWGFILNLQFTKNPDTGAITAMPK